jgi:polyhydroxyalkanoate synthesis regulator phasin
MSNDKQKAGDVARHIWLAGVGAYGRAVEEAQGRLEKAMEPPKLFRDLVKAGAALEEEARETTEAARHSVEERINRVRENFQGQRPARVEDLAKLQKKVDQLTRKVNQLSKALAEAGMGGKAAAGAPARKKRTAAKKNAGPRKKSAPKKVAAKKSPAGKTTRGSKSATSKHSR